jgi:HK97 gp10 family phage protein
MKINLKTSGVKELQAQLRYLSETVPENARKIMHRNADQIIKQAQINAPVDKHNLEKSIRKEVSYGFRGRLQIDIVVGGIVNGVNVDEYAALIHENYSSMTPGPGTLAKRQANPSAYVGEKFLERALRDQEDKLTKSMIGEILNIWKLP